VEKNNSEAEFLFCFRVATDQILANPSNAKSYEPQGTSTVRGPQRLEARLAHLAARGTSVRVLAWTSTPGGRPRQEKATKWTLVSTGRAVVCFSALILWAIFFFLMEIAKVWEKICFSSTHAGERCVCSKYFYLFFSVNAP